MRMPELQFSRWEYLTASAHHSAQRCVTYRDFSRNDVRLTSIRLGENAPLLQVPPDFETLHVETARRLPALPALRRDYSLIRAERRLSFT